MDSLITKPTAFWIIFLTTRVLHSIAVTDAKTSHAAVQIEYVRPSCDLDDNYSSPQLDRCLQLGNAFVDKYLKSLKNGQRTPLNLFNRCSESAEFLQCMEPLLKFCPVIRKTQRQWATIYDILQCSCDSTNSEDCYNKNLTCLEEQLSGTLAKRCDAYFRFNVNQRTRDKCHFEVENLNCKELLVRSACGAELGNFVVYAFKMSNRRKLQKRVCQMSLDNQYDGFSYSELCPATLSNSMNECRQMHLQPSMLIFHDENDLVAEGKKKDLQAACRGYREYKSCIRPLKKSCKQGVNLVYDYDGRLRTYLTKMEYICGEYKKDYMKQLPCYRDLLQNEALKRCDSTWHVLQPLLERVNAYEYYCRRRSDQSIKLQIVLDELRVCYENTFQDECGHLGGRVFGGLMESVFQDPFYLRYGYKPDCTLHRISGYREDSQFGLLPSRGRTQRGESREPHPEKRLSKNDTFNQIENHAPCFNCSGYWRTLTFISLCIFCLTRR